MSAMSLFTPPRPVAVRSSPTEVLSALAADHRRLERQCEKKWEHFERANSGNPDSFDPLAQRRILPTETEIDELVDHPFLWACRLVEDELYFQRGILPRLLAHEQVESPAVDRSMIRELRRFSGAAGWQKVLRQLHEQFPGVCEALGIVRPISENGPPTQPDAQDGPGKKSTEAGAAGPKRRGPRKKLTLKQNQAADLWHIRRSVNRVAIEMNIRPGVARKHLDAADRKLRMAPGGSGLAGYSPGSRSAPSRKPLPTGARGEVAVEDRDNDR
jgi:hypothetical protein